MSLAVDERTATRVGAVALIGALAGAVFVAVLLPQLALSEAVHVRVYYLELAGMREGAPVRSAGEVIGRVEAISFSPAQRPGPLEGVAGAVVHLALDPDSLERAWRDGEYIISSRGPLSSRYVEIIPPREGRGAGPVTEGAELRGVDPPTLDRVLSRTWQNLVIARRFAEDVGPEARQLRRELSTLRATWRELAGQLPGAPGQPGAATDPLDELLARFEALRDEAERSWQDVLGGQAGLERTRALWGKARALTEQARAVAGELAASIDHIRGELARVQAQVGGAAPGDRVAQLLEQLRGLTGKLDAVAASVRVVSERWQRREGTLGRLLTDPEFPEDAKELGKILKRQPWRIFGHPDDSAVDAE